MSSKMASAIVRAVRTSTICECLATRKCNIITNCLSRSNSSCSASVTRLKKAAYPRMYKARLVQPDGSTYTIRYHEPRKLICLPVDPTTLTEEERKERLRRLKPEKPKKIYQIEDDEGDFDQRSWTNLINKKT